MAIEPLRIVKTWLTGTFVKSIDFDGISEKIGQYATRTNNHLKQIGLDLGGSSYDFNANGQATQSASVLSRLAALESGAVVGASNLSITYADTAIPTLTSADGTALSSTNVGTVTINSTTTAGQLASYDLTANQSVNMTGAHWGFDAGGDLTDYKLWLVMIDTGSAAVFGVTAEGGKASVTAANCKTSPLAVISRSHILCASTVSDTSNLIYIGWIHASFDDTGGSSENLWAVQSGTADIYIANHPTYLEVEELRF